MRAEGEHFANDFLDTKTKIVGIILACEVERKDDSYEEGMRACV